MKLNTPILPEPFSEQLSLQDKSLFVGSCFTEHIGKKMKNLGFRTFVNPFGILYNPFSILHALRFIVKNKAIKETALVFHNELWHSCFHHGKYSNTDKSACLKACNNDIHSAHEFLKTAEFLVITLGSAWYYVHRETGNIMGNCHKMPSQVFEKKLSEIEEMKSQFEEVFSEIQKLNPQIKILFTVSPVRHWNDGYRENQISKSILHLLVHRLQQGNPRILYFPAYEILMDELRDYRFYDTDMLHPNALAIEIIWEHLQQALFSSETLSEIKKIEAFRQMYFHRPLHPQTELFRKHQQKVEQLLAELKQEKPYLDFDALLKV